MSFIELRNRKLEDDVVQLQAENTRLRAALGHYANHNAWTDHVIDSYSGLCHFFDWPGDIADEPYEIAEKALQENNNNDTSNSK